MDYWINQYVINCCWKLLDVDILVSGDMILLIGIIFIYIDYNEIDNNCVIVDEVDILLCEGEKLVFVMVKMCILCVYFGVCLLVVSDDDFSGCNVSCGIVLFDYVECDGFEGFIIIIGGKLMIYCLMVEWVIDVVCCKLGNICFCIMVDMLLSGLKEFIEYMLKCIILFFVLLCGLVVYWYGDCMLGWLSEGC